MVTELTAMYLFAGYRDAVKNNPYEQDINAVFSGGGEDFTALKLLGIAELYHKQEQEAWREGPGVWLYDVAEETGRAIAERVMEYIESQRDTVDEEEAVEMLVAATDHWRNG